MTREQARREIDSLDFYLQNHTDDYGEESHAAMMMAIEALEQEPGWIPVSERLPEDAQEVLVTRACRRNRRRRHFVETGEIIGGTWVSPNDEYRIEVDSYTVIAWMPLPAPFRAESGDKK